MLSPFIFEVNAIENALNLLMSRGEEEITAAVYLQNWVQRRVQSGVNLQVSTGKQHSLISAETHLFLLIYLLTLSLHIHSSYNETFTAPTSSNPWAAQEQYLALQDTSTSTKGEHNIFF